MQGAAVTSQPDSRRAACALSRCCFPPAAGCGAVLALLAVLLIITLPWQAQANPRYAGLVIDAVTGEVFYEENAQRSLYPASLTKIMTLYMTFQAIESGRLSLQQSLRVSSHAARQPPSKIGLPVGATLRVEDAIYALVTKSANDIAVVLAEAIGGSESQFARMMTEQARRLGMTRTTFRNASGLPDRRQRSTAWDMARLTQAMIRHYPQHYHFFGTRRWTFRGVTYRNHNRLLGRYDGMDGLKTGYINASGFNLVASVRRSRLRLIAVVFGGRTAASRNAHMVDLLDRALATERARHLVAHGSVPFRPPRPALHPRERVPAVTVVAEALPPAGPVRLRPTRLADAPADSALPAQLRRFPQPPALPAMRQMSTPTVAQASTRPLQIVPVRLAEAAGLDTAEAPSGEAVGDVSGSDVIEPPSGWGIQVGAFRSRTEAERAMDQATSAAPTLLSRAPRDITEVGTAWGRLHRARMFGFTESSAGAACERLQAAEIACLTLAPDRHAAR